MPPLRHAWYPLLAVKAEVASGRYVVTDEVLVSIASSEWERGDLERCVRRLGARDFDCSIPCADCPTIIQDVYRPSYLNVVVRLCVHLHDTAGVVITAFSRELL